MRLPAKNATLAQVQRQYTPPDHIALPPLRLFKVVRPAGMSDEMVEATGVGIEAEGVLRFVETVYVKHPVNNDEWVQQPMTRRLFRVWLDCEEMVGGMPMTSMIVQ